MSWRVRAWVSWLMSTFCLMKCSISADMVVMVEVVGDDEAELVEFVDDGWEDECCAADEDGEDEDEGGCYGEYA